MTDVSTYIIYIGLLLILIGFAKLSYIESLKKANTLNHWHFVMLIIISTFAAIRKEVGVDWGGYVSIFDEISFNKTSFEEQRIEIFYYLINQFWGSLGFGVEFVFFTVAFISWYFIFKSIPNYLLPLFIYFIFTESFFFWSMNGVRQFIALGFWLYSINFIIEKRFIWYVAIIFAGSLFHQSILILLPLYFLNYDKLCNNWVWFFLFLTSLLFLNNQNIIQNINQILPFLFSNSEQVGSKYLGYVDSGAVGTEGAKTGLGFYFALVSNGFLIFISNKVIDSFPKYKAYFVLFFISTIFFNFFYDSLLISRFTVYFQFLKVFISALTIYYYWKKDIEKYGSIIYTILCFILFLSMIQGANNQCCPYKTIF